MRAAHAELDGRTSLGGCQPELGAKAVRPDRGAHFAGAEVGALLQAESDHACARHAAPQLRELIIRVDHRGRRRSQACDHLALGARHALEAAETFEVLGSGVGDHADRGTRDAHQRGNFAGVVGTHLHYREAMLGGQAQQRERHADVVVEVAAGGQTIAGLT